MIRCCTGLSCRQANQEILGATPHPATQVRPLEEQFKFGHFFSPLLNESDFEAKPSVLLLGQYSTGGWVGGFVHVCSLTRSVERGEQGGKGASRKRRPLLRI